MTINKKLIIESALKQFESTICDEVHTRFYLIVELADNENVSVSKERAYNPNFVSIPLYLTDDDHFDFDYSLEFYVEQIKNEGKGSEI